MRQQPVGPEPGPVVFLPFRAALAQTMAIVVRTPGAIDAPVSFCASTWRVESESSGLPGDDVRRGDRDVGLERQAEQRRGAKHRWVALLLAVVGLYAVTGHTVERWRRELGLRVALGAGAGEIRWLVIRRVFAQLGTGLGVGVVGAQLFDRAFNDPADAAAWRPHDRSAALAPMAVSVGAIAVLACLPPIRRATRSIPIVALRTE